MPNGELKQTVCAPASCSILLVDDDVELCRLVAEYFAEKGYSVTFAHNGRDGLARALKEKVDLILLDGMLPVLDGLEVLRQLRRSSSVPVIMLTARTRECDRIIGLDSGADDYLPKPFAPDELLARIRAVLRRCSKGNQAQAEFLKVGSLELNVAMRTVQRAGEAIILTETEFQILEILMRSVGRTVSRDEISSVLYHRKSTPYERSLDVHISHLRKKVEQNGPMMIHTVRYAGYIIYPNVN
jgi:two-component system, OmpR family, response regulator CpxR